MMINRETAIDVLHRISESGFIEDGYADSLNEIAFCIEAENEGYHIWGAAEDCRELFNVYSSYEITPDKELEIETILKKYTFIKSPFERS